MSVGKSVMKENDHKMIFIQGHLCHIKQIFANDSVDLCLFACMFGLWVPFLKDTYISISRKQVVQL